MRRRLCFVSTVPCLCSSLVGRLVGAGPLFCCVSQQGRALAPVGGHAAAVEAGEVWWLCVLLQSVRSLCMSAAVRTCAYESTTQCTVCRTVQSCHSVLRAYMADVFFSVWPKTRECMRACICSKGCVRLASVYGSGPQTSGGRDCWFFVVCAATVDRAAPLTGQRPLGQPRERRGVLRSHCTGGLGAVRSAQQPGFWRTDGGHRVCVWHTCTGVC